MPEHRLIYIEEEPKPGFNVQLCLGVKETKGEIGIEIEVEGNKFPKPPGHEGCHKPVPMPNSLFWSYVHDGSLRGEDNAEYVLTAPIEFIKVPEAICEIYNTLVDYGSVIDVSNRTSVHVHLNCQEFHMNRLTTFMCAWFTLEEVLTEWCGDHRVGNMFCLRAVDAPAIVSQLRKFIRSDGTYPLADILHYAGLNPASLVKYGSLEVRTLRGCPEPQPILDWVSILYRLYELSNEYPDPRKLVSRFSQSGPMAFFDLLLGDRTELVRAGIEWDDDQIKKSMMRGIRFAQDLAYCRNWDHYKPVSIKADPFGRDPRKIAAQLMTPTPGVASGAAAVDPLAAAINMLQEPPEYDEPEPDYDDYPQEPEIFDPWNVGN